MEKTFGLLGERLNHSLSREIHAMLGDDNYQLFEVASKQLSLFLTSYNFAGINVTIPYKRTVMPMLSKTSELSRRVGCVNTVLRRQSDGRLFGYNTDVYGFSYMIDSAGINVAGKKCVIIGDGGGAASVRVSLEDHGAGKIVNITRSKYAQIPKNHPDAQILINATPVGMFPENGKAPTSLAGLDSLEAVCDLVYNPLKTALLLDAESRGIKAVNGLPMLVAQAKRARELFTGTEIDDAVIPQIISTIEKKQRNVIIIGMPGSGKSTVGKALAARLGKRHIDIDDAVMKLYGRSPERIIRREGENAFRRTEHVAAEWAGKQPSAVVSAGGGIVLRADNKNALRQNGDIIFINRDLTNLELEGRPLSQSKSIEDLYAERMPLYREWCDYEVDNNGTVEETVEQIVKFIGE